MHRAWLHRQEGFSLLETLVAMGLTVTVSLSIALSYSAMRLAQSNQSARFDKVGAVRAGAQQIAADLRPATWVYTIADCSVGTENTLTVLAPDGNQITYGVSGTQLQRTIAGGGPATVAYPISSLAVCVFGNAPFPTFKFTVANDSYKMTTTVVPRLMPNSSGVTME